MLHRMHVCMHDGCTCPSFLHHIYVALASSKLINVELGRVRDYM